ncbi:MAG: hypothetical protein JOZ62_04335 [Acidobacteriaceae bacterium]|nr:hypothetical protein [Acidobacteriaceae bacterium]
MHWDRIALYTTDALGIILLLRLLTLRLHTIYKVFSLYILYKLAGSCLIFAGAGHVAYRETYVGLTVIEWVLNLWMVYSLLDAILTKLPGILSFSRRVLNWAFLVAAVVALLSAKLELARVPAFGTLNPWSVAVRLVFIFDRVICTVAVLVLIAMLSFVLWFPVQMPRNLAVFSIGYLVIFFSETAFLLIRAFVSLGPVWNVTNVFLAPAWFGYLALFLTRQGESVPVTIGHGWRKAEQERLVQRLEDLNAALLRTSHEKVAEKLAR